MRSEPNEPPAIQMSVRSGPVARGGSIESVPPSDAGPSAAGVNVRWTRACDPGQSGSVERSTVGSAAAGSGTPAK